MKIIVKKFGSLILNNVYLYQQRNKQKTNTMKNLINYTNKRLANWYDNAKLDYNVIGNGVARIENNEFIIDYVENGISKTWKMCFYTEYLTELEKDYFFNVWMQEA